MKTPQQPVQSGFSAKSTADDVLAGQKLQGCAIVTGGHSGIGLETTRSLIKAGANVLVPARNVNAAREALGSLPAEVDQMDLADPKSVDAFAERFLASGRPLKWLINNAGVMALPTLIRDGRGIEAQLATNHVGHFQLTSRLWPALQKANGARIVSLSSRGHRRDHFHFEDPGFERRSYGKWEAYGQSKTANVLFAVEADARGEADQIRAFAVHPGGILTPLQRHLTTEDFVKMGIELKDGKPAQSANFKSPEQGAATTVWAATSPRLEGKGGVYCEDCEVAVIQEEGNNGLKAYAVDEENAKKLWAWTAAFFPSP